MRQLLYVSTSSEFAIGDQLANVLLTSRKNNPLNGLTGLLWTDGTRFLQVLEGEPEAVEATLMRIQRDNRHRAIVILHDRTIQQRTFGAWSMALVEDSDERISAALAAADPVVRGTFEGLINARRHPERRNLP